MEWTSFGNNNHAVVGYSAGTEYFYNYPLSGFSSVGESISCLVGAESRKKRQDMSQPTSFDMPLPVSMTLRMRVDMCRDAVERTVSSSLEQLSIQ